MTELQQYLAEEVAEDHADGIITRREAMRRLGLLGVGTGAATTLLAGFGPHPAVAARTPDEDYGGDHVEAWRPVETQSVTFTGPRGPIMAAWAPAARVRGGVLVIHENRGLTPHIALVAGRLAANGYASLAVGLLVVGAQRQRELEHALLTGGHMPLRFPTVAVFTVGGIVLAVATVILVIAQT